MSNQWIGDAIDAAYDKRVDELDGDAFQLAADSIAIALGTGNGMRIYFEPGDATRYLISVEPRSTLTISNGEATKRELNTVANTRISFGVADRIAIATQHMGHCDRLNTGHPWTNAVWRRLRAALALRLPREEW